ncbi:MAG: efflux RND transporter permease subunit [Candidatus Geothermincolia bacterium]
MRNPEDRRLGGRVPAWLRRLRRALFAWQTTRPVYLLGIALATIVVAAHGASQLTLKTAFGELLPQGKESVIVANKVNERLPAATTLNIVIQGREKESLKRFVDELSKEIQALGPGKVGTVDSGTRETDAFLRKYRYLYASLKDIQELRDTLVDRYEYEVSKAAGFDLELDDADSPPQITREWVEERLKKYEKVKAEGKPTGIDGYYLEPGGTFIVIMVRTPVATGDLDRQAALLALIKETIARVDPKKFDPAITIEFAGDFITGAEQYRHVKNDLSHVGLIGVAMILGVVLLYFLRVRTLVVMLFTIGIGVAWTFGFAFYTIGSLNSSTGFLFSIVVGNGINFGIIYMARYLEARRAQDVVESIRIANRETWVATLSAAGAAMVAYGSLVVTGFRGFKHFGVIGGSGMVFCWVATYLFLPAILVLSERLVPVRPHGDFAGALRASYGRPFAYLVGRWPRVVSVVGVAIGIVCLGFTVQYLSVDPIEYDNRILRTDTPGSAIDVAQKLDDRVEPITGKQGHAGVAIMVDRIEQVLPLKAALEAKRAQAPEGRKPFDKVVTIFDLLPAEQEQKIPPLLEARKIVIKARQRKLISEADWADIEKELPPADLAPIGIADLPAQTTRAFTEKDGARGRSVYVLPSKGRSVWDAHYLIEWAASFRSTTLPDGSVVKGSGNPVIFADLILSITEDAPKAILVSLVGTLLVIVFTFRRQALILAAIGSLALGLFGMVAVMALYKADFGGSGWLGLNLQGMKLNFLNFVALPISIGVGADYAVNLLERYRLLGPNHIRRVLRETGGAVVLCSLTTTLGYLALTFSANRAIVSFGIAAAAGEISCILAAVLVLPALLEWRARRNGNTMAVRTAGEPRQS